MVEEMYTHKAIKKTGVSIDQQAEASLSIAVLVEKCWKMAAVRELGEARARSLSWAAWRDVGKWAMKLAKAQGAKVTDLDSFLEVLKAQYTGFAIPATVVKDDPDEKVISVESCPFPGFSIPTFGVEYGDLCTAIWKDDTNAWIEGMIEEAGLTGVIAGKIQSALCMGDKEEIVKIEKIKK